jgi:hypothetical protein
MPGELEKNVRIGKQHKRLDESLSDYLSDLRVGGL